MNTEEVKNIVDVVDTVSGNAKGVFHILLNREKNQKNILLMLLKRMAN